MPSLAGSSLIFQWKWTRHVLKQVGSRMVLQSVYYYTTLVVNSRVLLMYTDTVKELPGYPVQNWEFPSLRGAVGRGGIVYDIV
jgi:hypothetical protein